MIIRSGSVIGHGALLASAFLGALLLFTLPSRADSVTLTNGQTFTGEIVSQTADEVVIRTAGGEMRVPMSRVGGVVSDRRERLELAQRQRTLSEKLVAEQLALARWCQDNGLGQQAARHFLSVLELDKTNSTARQELARLVASGPLVAEPEVEVTLIDGSRILGRLNESHLVLVTAYGTLHIPVTTALAVELRPEKGLDRVVTSEFPAVGDLVNESITITSRLGRLPVPLVNISSITIKHRPSPTFLARTLTEDLTNLRRIGLEVMLVCDTSESMEGALLTLKRDFNKLGNLLRSLVPEVRMGLVAYRDSRQHDPRNFEFEARMVSPLTSELHGLRQQLLSQQVSGGGDVPQAVAAGMTRAMENAGWTVGARKVIILIGDAPPRPEDDGLNTLLARVRKWSTESEGFVFAIDTTGFGRLMSEFKEIAAGGAGAALSLEREDQLARAVATCILNPKWSAEITRAYDEALDEPLPTPAQMVP